MTNTATWTKLKSGDWGVRVPYACGAGDSVTVTKKSGESRTVVIDRVVWSGQGVTLCAIARGGGNGGSRRHRRQRSAYERGDRSLGALYSHYDRRGAYAVDGTYLGTAGPRCEDAPCCGCCS